MPPVNEQQLFHWLFIVIFVTTFAISGYYRRKPRQSGLIRLASEGRLLMGLRVLFAAPLYLSFLAYLINPNWMAWSSVNLPVGLRWLAVLMGLGMLPALYWVMRSIGNNVSETFLTKEHHVLVTHGPYH